MADAVMCWWGLRNVDRPVQVLPMCERRERTQTKWERRLTALDAEPLEALINSEKETRETE